MIAVLFLSRKRTHSVLIAAARQPGTDVDCRLADDQLKPRLRSRAVRRR